MPVLRSLLFLLFQIATVIPFAFASIVMLPLPLHQRYFVVIQWPRLMVWGARVICGVRWEMEGFENLPDGPCVLLSNHQSAWETMFIPSHMPREVCFVYKRELHYVPFFGWGLASLKMIHIDRNQGRDAFGSVVSQGSQRLAEGRWIIMFPQGTRVPVGERRPYKQGGTRLAVQLGVPVVPIAHNAGVCWPRNGFIKKPGLVTVSIGKPIPATGKTSDTLMSEVERWIETEMQRITPVVPHHEPAQVAT
jgi:1-acyl-sn-glycerol-3-phosphate acyltransferase